MEPVSYKDKLKEEVSPEKRGDQRQLLSVSQSTPWWKCLFPIFCMNFFLLSGNNGTKKCYDPKANAANVVLLPRLSLWLYRQRRPDPLQVIDAPQCWIRLRHRGGLRHVAEERFHLACRIEHNE